MEILLVMEMMEMGLVMALIMETESKFTHVPHLCIVLIDRQSGNDNYFGNGNGILSGNNGMFLLDLEAFNKC